MRESNFRSAVANRASVNITTTLYDRRALDCTSDRPLINSLNHLAYLTSSSSRVRETLCFDGGLERLVAILKECCEPVGHAVETSCSDKPSFESVFGSQNSHFSSSRRLSTQSDVSLSSTSEGCSSNCCCEALVAWKWSLAFQCLLYLGTRGTESIRQRLVEAGAIPVIATILDNYLRLRDIEEASDCSSTCCSHTPIVGGQQHSIWNHDDQRMPAPQNVDPLNEVDASSLTGSTSSVVGNSSGDINMFSFGDSATPATLESSVATMASTDSGAPPPTLSSAVMSRAEQFVSQQLAGVLNNARIQSQLSTTSSQAMSLSPPRKFKDGVLLPRVEDVIWSLEILAFVSKYTYLRPLLQSTHLVPKLSARDPKSPVLLRAEFASEQDMEIEPCRDYDNYDFENTDDMDDEFKTEHLNIFPLVEKFTARREPVEVPYWSGIIMRNSCRKDEARGIRQCANFECARWESYPRQFAKCRRCKRTKYCSKQCQLQAWTYHRHWCAPVNSSTSASSRSTVVNELRPQSSGQTTAVGQPSPARVNSILPSHTQASLPRMDTESQQTTPEAEQVTSQILQPPQRIERLATEDNRMEDVTRNRSPFVWDSLDQSRNANVLTSNDQ